MTYNFSHINSIKFVFTAKNIYASVRLAEKRIDMQDNQRKNECGCERANKVNGVVCDVKNCAFHSGVNDCYAGSICVGPINFIGFPVMYLTDNAAPPRVSPSIFVITTPVISKRSLNDFATFTAS